MLASSSKRTLNVCSRAALKRRSVNATSSVWKEFLIDSPGIRAASTYSQAVRRREQPSQGLSGPSTRLWELGKDDSLQIKRGAHSTEYNMAMRDYLSRVEMDKVVDLVRKMKKTNVRPDVSTYNNLIHALALDYKPFEAWAVFEDMLAMGIQPDTSTFVQLLLAHRNRRSNQVVFILNEMNKHGVQPNARVYDFFIKYYLDCDNLEMALCKLAEMNDRGFSPNLKVAQDLIERVGQLGHVRLALELATAYEDTTVRRLDSELWVNMLVYCAEQLYVDGVLECWKKVVDELRIRVDEGLCQLVLNTAARHGLPALASEAIRQLEIIGAVFEERHFTPMVEAFVKNQQLKEAFCVLDLMRSAKTDPTVDSAYSILQAIQNDPELVDTAYTQLEEIHKEGQKIDVIAVNVLIKACGVLRDLQRAVGIYKAMPTLDVKPNDETFEMLLKACRTVRHIELGERLFGEIRSQSLDPTARTYEAYISLILTQADYENAFFYLEEMKGAGFTPSYPVYEEIVRTCVVNDDSRYKLAIEELEQMGYKVTGRLRNFINTGGQEWSEILSEEERLPFETRRRMKEQKTVREEGRA